MQYSHPTILFSFCFPASLHLNVVEFCPVVCGHQQCDVKSSASSVVYSLFAHINSDNQIKNSGNLEIVLGTCRTVV